MKLRLIMEPRERTVSSERLGAQIDPRETQKYKITTTEVLSFGWYLRTCSRRVVSFSLAVSFSFVMGRLRVTAIAKVAGLLIVECTPAVNDGKSSVGDPAAFDSGVLREGMVIDSLRAALMPDLCFHGRILVA